MQWAQWQENVQRQAWEDAQRRAAAQQMYPQHMYPQYGVPVQQVIVNSPVRRSGCPHLLHFVLTAVTCGAWLPVWIILALANS